MSKRPSIQLYWANETDSGVITISKPILAFIKHGIKKGLQSKHLSVLKELKKLGIIPGFPNLNKPSANNNRRNKRRQ